MASRSAAIRKSDLTPAFEAAKAAGYDQVSVVVETADGKRFHITAASVGDTAGSEMKTSKEVDHWFEGHRGNAG